MEFPRTVTQSEMEIMKKEWTLSGIEHTDGLRGHNDEEFVLLREFGRDIYRYHVEDGVWVGETFDEFMRRAGVM